LELRGYSLGAPTAKGRSMRSRYDRRFYVAAAAVLAAAIAGKLLAADAFREYPRIELGAGWATLALSGLLVLSGFVPMRRRSAWIAGSRSASPRTASNSLPAGGRV
ncbi:MAG: hypothetical protein ACRDLL_06090, partial [Solirubrobacterales bacterium]